MIPRKNVEEMATTLKGIPIWGALPGSPSHEAGIRYGDILVEVNGVLTPTIDEYLKARELRKDGYEVRLFRDGQELSLFIPFQVTQDRETMVRQIAEGRFVPALDSSEPKQELN